jgi:hypothetical protein
VSGVWRLGQPLSTISDTVKPRTAIVRNIFVLVGIIAKNSIISHSWVTWSGAASETSRQVPRGLVRGACRAAPNVRRASIARLAS